MILSDTVKIVVAGGGVQETLLPGLAVAEELRRLVPRSRVIFAGCGNTAEYRRICASGYEYHMLGPPTELGWGRSLVNRVLASGPERRMLNATRPAAVLTVGGLIGERVGVAAVRRGIPLVVFEPNPDASRVTRRLAASARLIGVAFAEAQAALFANCPVRVTGLPATRCEAPTAADELPGVSATGLGEFRRLVILGDDDHSRQLNATLPRVLHGLYERLAGWRVVHRTRPEEVEPIRRMYERFGINAVTTSHIHKLSSLLSRADLVVAASSSVDFAELAGAAAPTIVAAGSAIAATRWQGRIAQVLHRDGACVLVEELGEENVWTRTLAPLLCDPQRRQRLAQALQSRFRPDAAWHLANMVQSVLQ